MAVRDTGRPDRGEQELRAVVQRIRQSRSDSPARDLAELMVAAERLLAASQEETFVSTGTAAERLAIGSINTVKRWMREGLLEGRILHGRYYVSRRSIEALLASGDQRLRAQQEEHRRLLRLEEEDTLDVPLEEGSAHIRGLPGGVDAHERNREEAGGAL